MEKDEKSKRELGQTPEQILRLRAYTHTHMHSSNTVNIHIKNKTLYFVNNQE